MQAQEITVPVTDNNFNEKDYLRSNPDIAQAVREGVIESGKMHFEKYGRNEGRKMKLSLSTQPHSWMFKVLSKMIPRSLKKELQEYIVDQNTILTEIEILSEQQVLKARVEELEIFVRQVSSILHHESDIPPPPPRHLQERVVGKYVPDFIESGFTKIYPTLTRVLRPTGKELGHFHSILDFGCGCGRATRALASRLPGCDLYGTDIDEEAVTWLNRHYARYAQFSVAPHVPPTVFEDQKFDLIFGISVFTHLPEEMQFQWLRELSRVTKPSGYVLLTTHGENHYSSLDADSLSVMREKGFFYTDFGSNYGKSIQLPDFYQTAFHSHAYIQKEWGRYFDVIDIQPRGLDDHQDTILLRKRNDNAH